MKEISSFYKGNILGLIKDLENPSDEEIMNLPKKAGAYIILSKTRDSFIYPRGKSRVIYIGKANILCNRIKDHLTIINKFKDKALQERKDDWYYQRYQYIKEFGGQLFYFRTRGVQTPERLEYNIMEQFYDRFLALPVGNGAFPTLNS